MWWIILIFLAVCIIALSWWRQRQEYLWQQEYTHFMQSQQQLDKDASLSVPPNVSESPSATQKQHFSLRQLRFFSFLLRGYHLLRQILPSGQPASQDLADKDGLDQPVAGADSNNQTLLKNSAIHEQLAEQMPVMLLNQDISQSSAVALQQSEHSAHVLSEDRDKTAPETIAESTAMTQDSPMANLEVITLTEATRRISHHHLFMPRESSKPVVKEITADDPVLMRVRSRTEAERAVLSKKTVPDTVQQSGPVSQVVSSLQSGLLDRAAAKDADRKMKIIGEEDIRANLLRQRIARRRERDDIRSASEPAIPVIAEHEILANLAHTDSPVNKSKFQRAVIRDSVIPAAARIGEGMGVKLPPSSAGADQSMVQSSLSTRFTPFQPVQQTAMVPQPETAAIASDLNDNHQTWLNEDIPTSCLSKPMPWTDSSVQLQPLPMRPRLYTPASVSSVPEVSEASPPAEEPEKSNEYIGWQQYIDKDNSAIAPEGAFFDQTASAEPPYPPVTQSYSFYHADSTTANDEVSDGGADSNNNQMAYTAGGSDDDRLEPMQWASEQSADKDNTEEVAVFSPAIEQADIVPVVGNDMPLNQYQPQNDAETMMSEQPLQPAVWSKRLIDKPAVMSIQPSLARSAIHQSLAQMTMTEANLPGMDLLLLPEDDPSAHQSEEALLDNGITIEEKLAEFKVKVKVVDAFAGPVITRYEIEPAQGVRGSQVVNLEKDLARSLGFASIRVVETIPGKTCMGLELPNPKRQMIHVREIFTAPEFQQSYSKLTLALGQDITGQPMVTDLAKAPHLLVAGTTGSGKSVGVNAMILSILFKATPEQVRLIMIDPKMLELSIYEGIPHLLTPVVTDMKLAANALTWCVNEMEKRYRLMSYVGVRNLAGFNQKIADAAANGQHLANPFSLTPENPEPLQKLPYIVVVVDEFADLMMTAGKKIEELIARLAQKARAAGIHLILATQRPSVDVITGLIKANIPTRIAFQVSSKVDSRTILDQMGAENLLGQGDMLFLPPGTAYPLRIHGAFVADEEVHRVVHYLKQFGQPDYIDDILMAGSSEDEPFSTGRSGEEENDPLYDEAVSMVVKTRKASISSIQRQLRIGYNRAARMVEQMETDGIVSPPESNGSRTVLAPDGQHLQD